MSYTSFQPILDDSKDALPSVDLPQLRALCQKGIPHHPIHLRPLAYSLLLGVLPLDKREWKHVAKTQRAHYYGLVRAHMEHVEDLPDAPNPIDRLLGALIRDVSAAQSRFDFLSYTQPCSNAPLAPTRRQDLDNAEDLVDDDFSSSSSEDDELMARKSIPKSPRPLQMTCRRAIFRRAVPSTTPQLSLSAPDSAKATFLSPSFALPDSHAEVICRMIYIFVQANPQWTYNQGLVDLAANLYLIFSEIQWKVKTRRGVRSRVPIPQSKYAEERTYWAFCALVREYEAVLVGRLDQYLDCFQRRAEWSDEPLWSSLTRNDIAPSSYASRWFSLLLVGDIPPTFILPAWDFIISSQAPDALDALVDMCVAVLLISRPILLAETRSQTTGLWDEASLHQDPLRQLGLLRSLPLKGDPDALLHVANQLRTERTKVAGLGLYDKPADHWDTRLSSLGQAWSSSALASFSGTLAELTKSSGSIYRSWTLSSPQTPRSGPRPLLLSTRRGRDSPKRNS